MRALRFRTKAQAMAFKRRVEEHTEAVAAGVAFPKPPPSAPTAPKRPARVSANRRVEIEAYPEVRHRVLMRARACVLWGLVDLLGNPASECVSDDAPRARLEVHHVYGKFGERLLDSAGCVALHRECHAKVHANQKQFRPILGRYLRVCRTA